MFSGSSEEMTLKLTQMEAHGYGKMLPWRGERKKERVNFLLSIP
jgi:hypothetical protein